MRLKTTLIDWVTMNIKVLRHILEKAFQCLNRIRIRIISLKNTFIFIPYSLILFVIHMTN